jgi:hypothetical protein
LQQVASLVFRRSTRYPFTPDAAFQLTVTEVALVGLAVIPVGAGPGVVDTIGWAIGVRICAMASTDISAVIAKAPVIHRIFMGVFPQ